MTKPTKPQTPSWKTGRDALGAAVNRPATVPETRGQTVNQMKPISTSTSTTTTNQSGKSG